MSLVLGYGTDRRDVEVKAFDVPGAGLRKIPKVSPHIMWETLDGELTHVGTRRRADDRGVARRWSSARGCSGWRHHQIGRKPIALGLCCCRWKVVRASGLRPDRVRHWRWIFGREGVVIGLRARKAPGPELVTAWAALTVVEEVLVVLGSAELDIAALGRRVRGANRAAHLEIASQRGDARKGAFGWREQALRAEKRAVCTGELEAGAPAAYMTLETLLPKR